jgi:hypothetical protein
MLFRHSRKIFVPKHNFSILKFRYKNVVLGNAAMKCIAKALSTFIGNIPAFTSIFVGKFWDDLKIGKALGC